MGFDKLTVILKTIEVDDEQDIALVNKCLEAYLAKVHPEKRRIVCYVATEPVQTLNLPKEAK